MVFNYPLDGSLFHPNLNELTGTTGKDWMLWSIDTVAKYNDCKARHGRIIKALN